MYCFGHLDIYATGDRLYITRRYCSTITLIRCLCHCSCFFHCTIFTLLPISFFSLVSCFLGSFTCTVFTLFPIPLLPFYSLFICWCSCPTIFDMSLSAGRVSPRSPITDCVCHGVRRLSCQGSGVTPWSLSDVAPWPVVTHNGSGLA